MTSETFCSGRTCVVWNGYPSQEFEIAGIVVYQKLCRIFTTNLKLFQQQTHPVLDQLNKSLIIQLQAPQTTQNKSKQPKSYIRFACFQFSGADLCSQISLLLRPNLHSSSVRRQEICGDSEVRLSACVVNMNQAL